MPDQSIPIMSIVIVNYNYEDFIAAAIDSALGQNYPAVEVVVVDDGSVDRSREIIESYGTRITRVYQSNGGQLSGYDHGRMVATGKYVVFLDSDDLLKPNAVETVVAAFESSDAVKVQYYLQQVNRDLVPTGARFPTYPLQSVDTLRDIVAWGYYVTPPGSGSAYRADFLAEIMPLPVVGKAPGDGYLASIAGLTGRVVSVPEMLGIYRAHSANDSEISEVRSVAKVRHLFMRDYDRERVHALYAERFGVSVPWDQSRYQPGVCKQRLLSIRLEPENHPIATDTTWSLFQAGIKGTLSFPYMIWSKRIISIAGFCFLAIAPSSMLRAAMSSLVSSSGRGVVIRTLARNRT